jgi:hypothetical protein
MHISRYDSEVQTVNNIRANFVWILIFSLHIIFTYAQTFGGELITGLKLNVDISRAYCHNFSAYKEVYMYSRNLTYYLILCYQTEFKDLTLDFAPTSEVHTNAILILFMVAN